MRLRQALFRTGIGLAVMLFASVYAEVSTFDMLIDVREAVLAVAALIVGGCVVLHAWASFLIRLIRERHMHSNRRDSRESK